MAPKEKPYRVYRGGRAKGPITPVVARERRPTPGERDGRYLGPAAGRPRRRRARRFLVTTLVLLLLLAVAWAVLGYLAFRNGVQEANARLDGRAKRSLAAQERMLLSRPSNTLVLGTDSGGLGRKGRGRADAIMLIRSDPGENRVARLSVPRDLRVEIPGRGLDKVNASYAYGGAALAVRTVESVTGLRVNHIVVVDFAAFPAVVDALGGVTINVPRPILSNRFDCPYGTQAECDRWKGWRFAKGRVKMNGYRALVYARIRKNQLDSNENDLTRVRRQQQVLEAIEGKATSLGTFLRLPFIGDDLAEPLATDLSAGQLLQLGWIKKRTPASGTLNCNLGGDPVISGGRFYIQATEENVSVVAMVTGKTAPQPAPPGSGAFGPGCRVGNA